MFSFEKYYFLISLKQLARNNSNSFFLLKRNHEDDVLGVFEPPPPTQSVLLSHSSYETASVVGKCKRIDKARHGDFEL